MNRVARKRSTAGNTQATSRGGNLGARKRLLFIILCLLFPILAIAAVEGILRAIGHGGFPPTIRAVGETDRGKLLITDRDGPASYFQANKSTPGSNDEYAIYSPKPPNTIRIFLAGGSAIKGFPQPMGFASSAFLQEMLSDLRPDRQVEVINLGTTAIASFPVMEMVAEAVQYEADLVVVYCGHNEFYGAYGVASVHGAGLSPGIMRLHRWAGSLATIQFLGRFRSSADAANGKTLMERVIGRASIPPGDALRAAAARNLQAHTEKMIRTCRARDVPIIVCTLPSNERDLAPLGIDDFSDDDPGRRSKLQSLLQTALDRADADPQVAIEAAERVVAARPEQARAHYALGRARFASGDHQRAAESFRSAVDFDPMPWRAPSQSIDAIRKAVKNSGAVICDVQQAFRDAGPGGSIGWELMDDHVHPSLRGQALIAEAILKTLAQFDGPLAVSPVALRALPSWRTYAKRLGDNPYDRFGVAHTIRTLSNIPFYKATNPGAFERFNTIARDAMASLSPALQEVAIEWQRPSTHKGAKRPMSGMAGRVMLREKRYHEADQLFRAARRCVPHFSAWNLEYTYFMLVCRQKIHGSRNADERQVAADGIARGNSLLKFGQGQSGQTERYIGRLHQLREEHEQAIPFLEVARKKLYEMDRVATDVALVDAYLKAGKRDRARRLVDDGIRRSGRFAPYYRELRKAVLKNTPTPTDGEAQGRGR